VKKNMMCEAGEKSHRKDASTLEAKAYNRKSCSFGGQQRYT